MVDVLQFFGLALPLVIPGALARLAILPRDIHDAVGLLLDCVGNTEGADDDAYNLVLQWWEQVPGESGIDPYPD